MCAPGCQEFLHQKLTRRAMLVGAAAATTTTALPIAQPRAQTRFTRAIDLTHTMSPEFPTFSPDWKLSVETLTNFAEHGFNSRKWTMFEHSGTHIDAPLHFSADGTSADQLDINDLVAPLAVIDVKAKAADNADYELTPDDVRDWESRYGDLPERGCVALNSGWDRKVGTDGFVNAGDDGKYHFPGFHPETAAMLREERSIVGLVVDTLSLDHGPSGTFGTHYDWLPSGRWGAENVANLDAVPASGATLIVGGPKVQNCTGGPSRVLALV